MNFKEHLLCTSILLNLILSGYIVYIQSEFGVGRVFVAMYLTVFTFLFGATLPDWDHEAVQKKLRFLWWIQLRKITKHRGWWHTITASAIYGLIIALPLYFLGMYYWCIPAWGGVMGFNSHLIEDDVKRPFQDHKPRRGFKLISRKRR